MQDETPRRSVRVLIEMVDALGVEQRCPAFDAVHDVSLAEEKLRQVGTILSGDAGDQRDFRVLHVGAYCSVRASANWTRPCNEYKIQRPAADAFDRTSIPRCARSPQKNQESGCASSKPVCTAATGRFRKR